MLNSKTENKLFYFFLTIVMVLQVYLILVNEKTFGGTDNITHFQIAKYAFKYPELFLDHWGKPLYTTLSAPFAFFGFRFAQGFNVIVAILTLLVLYKTAKSIFAEGAILPVILTAFAPIYFFLTTSCLTEILFSFILVSATFLFIKNRFVFSAIVLSFIPFVRSEGIVLMPVFATAFILKRSYISILFLTLGTLFYSFTGLFVFDDFLWIINRFPYPKGESVYGNGELLHFVKKSNFIFGLPFLVLLASGTIYWMFDVFRKFRLQNENVILFILIVGSWIGYFAAHSFVWWKGMGGSLGLIRVMGGIIPLAALSALKGTQLIAKSIKNKKYVFAGIWIIAGLQIVLFFTQNKLPLKAGPVEKLISQSSAYISEMNDYKMLYYFNPEFLFYTDIDPYDKTKSNWGVGDKLKPSNTMDYGDLLIWDAHFGPNEGKTSLSALENDDQLQKQKSFFPIEQVKVLGGYDYEIHIFKKVKTPIKTSSSEIYKSKLKLDPAISKDIIEEKGDTILNLLSGNEYSPTLVINTAELLHKDIFETELLVDFKSTQPIEEKEVLLVISVENGKDKIKYASVPLVYSSAEMDWKTTTAKTRFSSEIPDSAIIKMYIWNRGKKQLIIKNLEATITSY